METMSTFQLHALLIFTICFLSEIGGNWATIDFTPGVFSGKIIGSPSAEEEAIIFKETIVNFF